MALNMTPIHKNLHTRVTFLGLEFEDLVAVMALAISMNLGSHFVGDHAKMMGIPLNLFMEIGVPVLAIPFLMLFKYGKPRGYLQDLVMSFIESRAWCALERDSVLTTPYIRDEDDGDEEDDDA
jgi:hypothetical protein